jgi:hypothetical protein
MIHVIVCLLAFKSKTKGNLYLEYAHNLIGKIQSVGNIPIILMTDDVKYFNGKAIYPINIDNPSYTDKIKVCEVAIKYGYTAVYLDVDTTLDFKLLEKIEFKEGFHFWWWWKREWMEYKDLPNKNYFKKLENYCIENGLQIDNAPLIHEGFFAIKNGDNMDKFLKIYHELSKVAIENDIELNNYPTGRGEGLLMGIALINSGFRNNGCGDEMMLLGHNLYQDKSPSLKNQWDTIQSATLLDNKKII